MQEYIPIFLFILVAVAIASIMVLIPKFIAPLILNRKKIDSYECGFNQLSSTESMFNIRFYLIAIIFIIFDLEIIFLFPWTIMLKSIGKFGFISMMIFLSVLTIGFIYELTRGALEWD
jgi:NADH-quinone oxidoreductase subunit A